MGGGVIAGFSIVGLGKHEPFVGKPFPFPVSPCTVEISLKKILYPEDWVTVRRASFRKFEGRCSVCDGVGDEWPVAGVAVWDFDLSTQEISGYGVQRLSEVVSLCPRCLSAYTSVLSLFRYGYSNKLDKAMEYLAGVGNSSIEEVADIVYNSYKKSEQLEDFAWATDLSWLKTQGLSEIRVSSRQVVCLIDGVIVGGC